ncbi:hypothetical protein DN730_06125 [Marinomonas piezotolerans]|uniref:Pirin family protein n=1 Tax=Marinomonas piezotolerans TaxID=2213058 RepID=A0A370UBW5_9GAMM|nr:pirin family protein [Marinomonas piezotolerans]RDL45185.1 hypothetical protein DN730_06125 [Marinomonas piezotolerans]
MNHEMTPISSPYAAIKIVLTPKEKDLGGFTVKRSLPTRKCRSVGPWVFFDHIGPASFSPGDGVDVPPHPHIGLATVTYLFEGEMLHRDSLGNTARIVPGDINLMVSGKGITHSERQRPETKAANNHVHGLQLWLALPQAQEQIDPEFYSYEQRQLPRTEVQGVPVRVMMGEAYDVVSPVKTYSPTLYCEAKLKAGQTLTLPHAAERGLYLVNGQLELMGDPIDAQTMVILTDQPDIEVTAREDSVIVLVGGETLGTRYMDWNFVASNKSLIEQAKQNWQQGNFPIVPGDEHDYIPLPN